MSAVLIDPKDAHRPWARKAIALGAVCACPDCLETLGAMACNSSSAQHKRPAAPTEPPEVIRDGADTAVDGVSA